MKRLTKMLMDGGSSLNILYAETLDAMGISHTCLRPSRAPFHGVILGKQAKPLGQIDLPITFGTPTNFGKETLTFEVVGFHGPHHAILGRPCYAKYMAVPNNTYLKLKMPGPHEVITISTSFQRTYECNVKCCEHASAILASKELPTIMVEATEGSLIQRSRSDPSSLWKASRRFPSIPATTEARRCASVPPSPPNRIACSSTFSAQTRTFFV
jgi:hypothetical protein